MGIWHVQTDRWIFFQQTDEHFFPRNMYRIYRFPDMIAHNAYLRFTQACGGDTMINALRMSSKVSPTLTR